MFQRKLGFVVAGAQKSATTTLDALLRLHPAVQMASRKETHFFDDDTLDWRAPDYRVLDAFFASQDERLRGEATPITLYWRPAIERLQRYHPGIKLVLLLRDPVARAYSNWQQEIAIGRETLPFDVAIREGRRRVAAQTAPRGLHRYFSYVERGFYGRQLDHLLGHFGRDQVHCAISEEFHAAPLATLQGICRFLEIDPFPPDTPSLHLNAAPHFPYPSSLNPADADYLAALFAADIAHVEAFLGRRVCAWSRRTGVGGES